MKQFVRVTRGTCLGPLRADDPPIMLGAGTILQADTPLQQPTVSYWTNLAQATGDEHKVMVVTLDGQAGWLWIGEIEELSPLEQLAATAIPEQLGASSIEDGAES